MSSPSPTATYGVPMMQTDKVLQPLGGKDCVTGERIEVVHADDCRKIELEGLEMARELAQANNDLQETMQILGDILAPGGGIHIGDVPSMARDVANKFAQSAVAGVTRTFPICKDHTHVDWNQPVLDDDSCVLCRLFYLEAQESLLEEWQQRAKRAEEALVEVQRPLDAQMARLNETVVRLNEENERLRKSLPSSTAGAALPDKWIAVPRQMTDEMFNAFSQVIGPLPEQYARITKAWYLAVHAAPQLPQSSSSASGGGK